jgi:hypothetical protein
LFPRYPVRSGIRSARAGQLVESDWVTLFMRTLRIFLEQGLFSKKPEDFFSSSKPDDLSDLKKIR